MKSINKLRHIQESNLRLEKRYLVEQSQEGVTDQIIPNLDFFKSNPKGTLIINQMGSVLDSVNQKPVQEDMKSMNSDQIISGGTYFYEYKPGDDGKINGRDSVRLYAQQNYNFDEPNAWFYPVE